MSDYYVYMGLNRTLCDVLEEMRTMDKTKNYSSLLSLIEEVQSMGNRMEASLGDLKSLKDAREKIKAIKKELKNKRKELEKLEEK